VALKTTIITLFKNNFRLLQTREYFDKQHIAKSMGSQLIAVEIVYFLPL